MVDIEIESHILGRAGLRAVNTLNGEEATLVDLAPERTLSSIEGYRPGVVDPPSGCRFSSRCPFAIDACFVTEPPLIQVEPGHSTACHRWPEIERLRAEARQPPTWQSVG